MRRLKIKYLVLSSRICNLGSEFSQGHAVVPGNFRVQSSQRAGSPGAAVKCPASVQYRIERSQERSSQNVNCQIRREADVGMSEWIGICFACLHFDEENTQ